MKRKELTLGASYVHSRNQDHRAYPNSGVSRVVLVDKDAWYDRNAGLSFGRRDPLLFTLEDGTEVTSGNIRRAGKGDRATHVWVRRFGEPHSEPFPVALTKLKEPWDDFTAWKREHDRRVAEARAAREAADKERAGVQGEAQDRILQMIGDQNVPYFVRTPVGTAPGGNTDAFRVNTGSDKIDLVTLAALLERAYQAGQEAAEPCC